MRQNDTEQLAALFRRAVEHQLQGRPEEALKAYDTVLRLNPKLAAAYCNRGIVLQGLGRIDDALRSYDAAIRIEPRNADAHYNRGTALGLLNRPGDALRSYDQAIKLKPDHLAAHVNTGATLRALKRPQEALESFDRALALHPGLAPVHNHRGNVLADLNRGEEALQSFDAANRLEPDFAEAWYSRAVVLFGLRRIHDAVQSFDRVILLQPDLAEAHHHRGNALRDLRRPQEALRSYDRALALRSDFALAALSKGMCLLQTGHFEEGWPLYEWRKRTPDGAGIRNYPQPQWSGTESLEGRTLFIRAEQGLGDTIQFCRYAPLARDRGWKVVFAVPDCLVRLLKDLGPGIDVVGVSSHPPEFDYHIPLLSLPLAFRTGLANCPSHVPYLRAEPERIERWRERLGTHGFRIGISWQGNRKAEIDAGRSFSLRHFEALAKIPGVRLISLQKNDGIEQLLERPDDFSIETPGADFDMPPDAFIDTAAVMEILDLVITSDTSIAHLAGALGRPTWVALKHVPDWRWLLDRSDSPWYPTLRLFRQPAANDWPAVFAAMQSRLAAMRQTHVDA